ncbi:MAG: sensor histidine kinase [Neomegalonema sp.]|nr:sensor histidine kinase [Neomegalonema sp.]
MKPPRTRTSLRQRLTAQLLVGAALLSLSLYGAVRYLSTQAAQRTFDNVLGASVVSIVDAVRIERGDVKIDIPYSAFSMLGAMSEDRVFYRVAINGETATGYDDLPSIETPKPPARTSFRSALYRGAEVRIAVAARLLTVNGKPVEVVAAIAQTTHGQAEISDSLSNAAALIGIGFFLVAIILSRLTAESALTPIRRLASSVERRGPGDLRPVRENAPSELAPLVVALNRLIARLADAIRRSEDFIAEAAHRIRTPLATVRAKAEIALRQAQNDEDRRAAREIISAVDASSRSAGQLLDHATVRLRSDQHMRDQVDLFELVQAVIESMRPAAELRDITIAGPDPAHEQTQLRADPVLLEGALRNLIDNAVKYSSPESYVRITLRREAENARITIRDQGRGLAGQSPDALFGRFYRGENIRDVVGSGLGLTIVAEAVAAHGGRIELRENEKETGACADLWLPLARRS